MLGRIFSFVLFLATASCAAAPVTKSEPKVGDTLPAPLSAGESPLSLDWELDRGDIFIGLGRDFGENQGIWHLGGRLAGSVSMNRISLHLDDRTEGDIAMYDTNNSDDSGRLVSWNTVGVSFRDTALKDLWLVGETELRDSEGAVNGWAGIRWDFTPLMQGDAFGYLQLTGNGDGNRATVNLGFPTSLLTSSEEIEFFVQEDFLYGENNRSFGEVYYYPVQVGDSDGPRIKPFVSLAVPDVFTGFEVDEAILRAGISVRF